MTRTLLGCPTMQFVRYPTAADIPSHLITRGVTLRGVAIATKSDGCLEVWHTPPGRRWLRWKLVPPSVCVCVCMCVSVCVSVCVCVHMCVYVCV